MFLNLQSKIIFVKFLLKWIQKVNLNLIVDLHYDRIRPREKTERKENAESQNLDLFKTFITRKYFTFLFVWYRHHEHVSNQKLILS